MGQIWYFFQIRFQYILAHRAKMYGNLIWKSPGFVPFGDNLNNFGPNFATLTVSLLIRYTYHISARCVARALLLYNSQSERDVTIIGHGQYHSITVLPQVGQGSGTFICTQYLSCIACPRKIEPPFLLNNFFVYALIQAQIFKVS